MKIRCPRCKELTTMEENPWRPFCSERCKLIDLGKWLMGEYKIEDTDESEENSTASSKKDKGENEGK